jgi:hypothetical protein
MRDNLNSTKSGITFKFSLIQKASGSKFPSFIILLYCFAIASYLSAQPVDIGNRRQLFVDNRFVQDERNIEFLVHPPRKTGEISIPSDSFWGIGGYHSVLEKDGIYHMWYTASASILYAQSKDGIHWECPPLNLTTDINVTKPNNVVIGRGAGDVNGSTHGLMVFLDPNATDDQRFCLVANPPEYSSFLQLFSSPDGIHWKHTHSNILIYDTTTKPHHLDTQNVIFWDPRLKKYVTYIRKNVFEFSNEGISQGRSVARGESSTLNSFGQAIDLPVVMRAGGRVDLYTNGVIPYPWAEDVYFAFPTLYYHYGKWQREFVKESPTNAGIVDTRFAVSRDGIIWNNFNWTTFVSLGMDGEFDSKRIYMVYGIVPALNEREMYMYYWGTNETHGWNRDDRNNRILTAAGVEPRPTIQRAISRVVLRRDGFVSLHAPYGGGEFTTPLMRYRGNQLVLNIETASTGEVQVELQDENGKPIPGFSLADCDLIHTANEINRTVTWNGVSMIGNLAGKTIRLHFILRDTDLYAFQFRDRPAF